MILIPPRFAAGSAITGAFALVAGTMMHPMDADPSDALAAFTEYAGDTLWTLSHQTQFAGVLLMFLGLAGLADTMRDEAGGWLARLGVLVGIAALAGGAMLQAVDGFALKHMVDTWAAASADQKPAAFMAALAVRQIETGTAAYSATLFGLAVALLGGTMTVSTSYPRWLGWLGVIGGLGTLAGGIAMVFTGFSNLAMSIGMPANLTVIGWIAVCSFLMWRRAQ
jgi:hypothetical protein